MIRPRIKDAAKELCEQLAEIYMAKNDEKKLEIAVQIKTKIILLQFILHMWENGFIIENDKSGRNTVEKRDDFIHTAEFYRGDIIKGIWGTVPSF